MKSKYGFISKGILIGCMAAGLVLPELVFSYLDQQNLNHGKKQKVEESNIVLLNKSSIAEKLSVFYDGYQVFYMTLGEEEKETALKTAKEEITDFLSPIASEVSLEQAKDIEITKHIYSSDSKDSYSFAAYQVKLEYDDCEMKYLLDMESHMILRAEFNVKNFKDIQSQEEAKEFTEDYGPGYARILIHAASVGKSEVYDELIRHYYQEFQIEGNLAVDTTADLKEYGVCGGGSGKDMESDERIFYYTFEENGESITYRVRITDCQVVFNA